MSGINKVFRAPSGGEYKYAKVEEKREQGKQKKNHDEQQQKKKKDEKMDNLFSNLADNLSGYGDI